MADYLLSHKAIEDLSAIWNYTFDAWSERQADVYYHLLLESCQKLAINKTTGRHYPEIGEDIFGFGTGLHIIFYRKNKKGKTEIIRILHSNMDLRNRMQE